MAPYLRFLLAAALLLALVGAVNAQSADGLESYKRAAQEYLAQAQGLATKYGAQAGDVAKDYYEKGSTYVQGLIKQLTKKDEL